MSRIAMVLITSLLLSLTQAQYVFDPKNAVAGSSSDPSASVPLEIEKLVNNRAFGIVPGDADFDGGGNSYPAQYLPPSEFVYAGINFTFPQYRESGNDNVLAQGQNLTVPKGRYQSVYMLAAGSSDRVSGTITGSYAEGNITAGPILVPAWYSWPYPSGGDIIFPYYLTQDGKDYNRSMIFLTTNWLDSSRELTSLTLPNVSKGLHIFAISLQKAATSSVGNSTAKPTLQIQYARSTQMWMEGTNKTQIVEVVVNNVGEEWVLKNNEVKVSVLADGVKTVVPGIINRLKPGDQVKIHIGVVNQNNTTPGTTGKAIASISGTNISETSYTFNATYGISAYEATYESIYSHETPPWYNAAKYGIFIHWGVYSAPGWGNTGSRENYAEWYWYSMNQGPNTNDQTYQYNLATYGPNHTYDEFISNFTAEHFDPKEWVDLFADAGAQYFVQVSKHHDGFALFDLPENVSTRTSVKMGPGRNLLQELFDASQKYQPHLHRATYFSLPEWFHPDYKKYGFGSWPGGNASNPYTGEILPYAGYVPVSDFISDVILPEMQTLAAMGTEIMWCDIGGPNLTAEFASEWFNTQAKLGKQVVLDNRCGLPGDFDTPEYARYDAVQSRKWESNLGMDPFSYGYNRATPLSAYMNASSIITSLLDIVSKNGNFLLDIGPMANGTILDVEARNLREAGSWIKDHEEAIFNTTYWFVTPNEGDNVRFTLGQEAFYISFLKVPEEKVVLKSGVPFVEGDKVLVVGGKKKGESVPAKLTTEGLELDVSQEVRDADQFAWVFKIPFV